MGRSERGQVCLKEALEHILGEEKRLLSEGTFQGQEDAGGEGCQQEGSKRLQQACGTHRATEAHIGLAQNLQGPKVITPDLVMLRGLKNQEGQTLQPTNLPSPALPLQF